MRGYQQLPSMEEMAAMNKAKAELEAEAGRKGQVGFLDCNRPYAVHCCFLYAARNLPCTDTVYPNPSSVLFFCFYVSSRG